MEDEKIGKYRWCEVRPALCDCHNGECNYIPSTPREKYISASKRKNKK